MSKQYSRRNVKGILTDKERDFLLDKGHYNPNSVRYYRSHILHKTRKAIRDLDLVFGMYPAWQIFTPDTPDVKKIIRGAAEIQYNKNYAKAFHLRLRLGLKQNISKKVISRITKKQITEIVESTLDELQTKPEKPSS